MVLSIQKPLFTDFTDRIEQLAIQYYTRLLLPLMDTEISVEKKKNRVDSKTALFEDRYTRMCFEGTLHLKLTYTLCKFSTILTEYYHSLYLQVLCCRIRQLIEEISSKYHLNTKFKTIRKLLQQHFDITNVANQQDLILIFQILIVKHLQKWEGDQSMVLFIQSSFLKEQVNGIANFFEALYCIHKHNQQHPIENIQSSVIDSCYSNLHILLNKFEEHIKKYYIVESMHFQLKTLMKLMKRIPHLFTPEMIQRLIGCKHLDDLPALFCLLDECVYLFETRLWVLEVYVINIVLDRVKPEWQKIE